MGAGRHPAVDYVRARRVVNVEDWLFGLNCAVENLPFGRQHVPLWPDAKGGLADGTFLGVGRSKAGLATRDIDIEASRSVSDRGAGS